MNELFDEQYLRRDIKALEDFIHKMTESIRPRIWRHLRWRFLVFWCFLWLYVFHQTIAYALGIGVGTLLVLHAAYNLYLCKCAINVTKSTITHIEGYIRVQNEKHTSD